MGRASAWTPWRISMDTLAHAHLVRMQDGSIHMVIVDRVTWRCRERSRPGCVRSGRAAVHAPATDWLSRYEIHIIGNHDRSNKIERGSARAAGVSVCQPRGRRARARAPGAPRGGPALKHSLTLSFDQRHYMHMRHGPHGGRARGRSALGCSRVRRGRGAFGRVSSSARGDERRTAGQTSIGPIRLNPEFDTTGRDVWPHTALPRTPIVMLH